MRVSSDAVLVCAPCSGICCALSGKFDEYQIKGIFVCSMFTRKLTALDYHSQRQFDVNGKSDYYCLVCGSINDIRVGSRAFWLLYIYL